MSVRGIEAIAMVLLVSFAAGCGGETATEPNSEETLSPTARAYLNAALDIMQAHSINRYKINWHELRVLTFRETGLAQTTADTYEAIRFAIQRLGDNHSFFIPPGNQSEAPALPRIVTGSPWGRHLGQGIGYVSVPAFSGGGDAANQLATDYHRIIEGVDTVGVCGWVVDLRGNTGGNMWPMVAGVGPIVGEGVLGYFVDPDSVVQSWTYVAGASHINGTAVTRASEPYELLAPDPPAAVLTDSMTASSGEATVIAFRGRPGSRSFGRPTWGVSTANRSFPLSDGAILVLTVSTMADRTGVLYGGKVVPDQDVPGARTGTPATDPPLAAAIDWLRRQTACVGYSLQHPARAGN